MDLTQKRTDGGPCSRYFVCTLVGESEIADFVRRALNCPELKETHYGTESMAILLGDRV